jgi:hypothetical protein
MNPFAPSLFQPIADADASQRAFRQRAFDMLDAWSQGDDHGVQAYDEDLKAHEFEPYAIGSFALVRTRAGRLYALIRVDTVLGHLCLAIHLERYAAKQLVTTGFGFGDIIHAVTHVADDMGHGAAKGLHAIEHVAEDAAHGAAHIGSGVVHAAQSAINSGAHAIEAAVKESGGAISSGVKAAAHLVLRAHFGDLSANNIIKGIVNAAKSGVALARNAANTLAKGLEVVTKAVDLPKLVADAIPIPAVRGVISAIDPLQKFGDAIEALRKGDMRRLKQIATDALSTVQGVVSLVPGIGTGISAALSTAEGLLEGGSPLDVAVHAAYGAIPIPPGLRQVTDTVLEAVLALVDGKNLTDAGLAVARDRIPSGIPREVFDTLVNVVVKHRPVAKATEDLALHYVKQYTSGVGDALEHGLGHTVGPSVSAALAKLPDARHAFESFPSELKRAAHGALGQTAHELQAAAAHAASTVASAATTAAPHGAAPGVHPLLPLHLAFGGHAARG